MQLLGGAAERLRRDKVANRGLPNREQILKRMWKLANAGVGDAVKLACFPEEQWGTLGELDLDGLKTDFIDSVLPDTEKPRCRAAYTAVKELIRRVKAHKKEALIEFRQRYATPLMASLATAFRAGDVPFDYMENFSRCVQIRLLMGDKVPVHADPVYFNSEETLEAVGRHLIAALAGVPMVSMELSSIRQEHKKVIKNYLAFYRENQHILNMGHWEFDFHNNFASYKIILLDFS